MCTNQQTDRQTDRQTVIRSSDNSRDNGSTPAPEFYTKAYLILIVYCESRCLYGLDKFN